MLCKQRLDIVEAPEDTPSLVFQDILLPRHSRPELITREDLEKRHDLLDGIRRCLVEDAVRPSLLTQVIGEGIFQRERASPRPIDSSTVSAAARGPQAGQKAVAP